jgi:Flp pilus assembly protein TadB
MSEIPPSVVKGSLILISVILGLAIIGPTLLWTVLTIIVAVAIVVIGACGYFVLWLYRLRKSKNHTFN